MLLNYRGDVKDLVKLKNIASLLDDNDLKTIGLQCKADFEGDKASRNEWESWYADAMKLALQIMEDKSFPWPGCSNVKFPLLTIAAINFHARAYPTLINGNEAVAYKTIGTDDDGGKKTRAKRVADHQNYLLFEASDWEEQTDKALIVTPIMGCSFKKTYNGRKGLAKSDLILPQDLVVPYFIASLEESPRISQCFKLNPNSFVSKKRLGVYLDIDYLAEYTSPQQETGPLIEARREAQKIDPTNFGDNDLPIQMIEQHRFLDLDGDGYQEPYIVTFIRDTGQICRIVARYGSEDIVYVDKKIAHIEPLHFFTKIPFIPSPDGGFYDMGFGLLLGPLNYAADSLINQLIDAGTMHNLGGGFLGRGVKIRRGESTFVPMEWKSVESSGSSLKDNIFSLPVRNPSEVLLQLLTFLVQYAERISSANEIAMGEIPGQNVKAEVMRTATQNGLRIFFAIYKRMWRALKEEFRKYYKATGIAFKTKEGYAAGHFKDFGIEPGDYDLPTSGICPAADPNVASKEQSVQKAQAVLQTAMTVPGQDVREAVMRYYSAMDVENPELIFPDPKGPNAIPAQPDARMIDANAKMLKVQSEGQDKERKHMLAVATAMQQAKESQAKIVQLQAQAAKLHADANGVGVGHAIALIDTQIGAAKHHFDSAMDVVKLLTDNSNANADRQATTNPAGVTDSGTTGVLPLAGTTGDPKVLPLSSGPAA